MTTDVGSRNTRLTTLAARLASTEPMAQVRDGVNRMNKGFDKPLPQEEVDNILLPHALASETGVPPEPEA